MDVNEKELIAVEGQRIMLHEEHDVGGVMLLNEQPTQHDPMVNLVFSDGSYRQYIVSDECWDALRAVCARGSYIAGLDLALWRENVELLLGMIMAGHLLTADTPGHTYFGGFAENLLPLHKRTRSYQQVLLHSEGRYENIDYVLEVKLINESRLAQAGVVKPVHFRIKGL